MRVKELLLMMNSKDPPDGWKKRRNKMSLRKEIPEFNAAFEMRNRIKQTITNNVQVTEDICELKFKIFILNHVISEQILKTEKMSANSTLDNSDVKNFSDNGTPEGTPASGNKDKQRIYCNIPGCKKYRLTMKKMEAHLRDDHNLKNVSDDTVNTTIFNEGVDSPTKHSTQTPATATATPKANITKGKGKRQLSPKQEEEGPATAKMKMDESQVRFEPSQVDEEEWSKAAEDVENQHSETVELLRKVREEGEKAKEVELEETAEEEGETFMDADEEIKRALSPEKEKNPGAHDDDESVCLLAQEVTSLEVSSFEDHDGKRQEENEILITELRSNEMELKGQVSRLIMEKESLYDLLDEERNKVKALQEVCIQKDKKINEAEVNTKDIEKRLNKAENFNEEWKKVGKEYLAGSKSNKEGVNDLKKKYETLLKKVETLTIQRDRAIDNANNQKDLADKTQAALVQEQGEHAKTKRRIPCNKPKCEDMKNCPYGHKKDRKNEVLCTFFNSTGCNKGDSCRFKHVKNDSSSGANGTKDDLIPPPQTPKNSFSNSSTKSKPPQKPTPKNTHKPKPPLIKINTPSPVPTLQNNNSLQEIPSGRNLETEEMEVDEEVRDVKTTEDNMKTNKNKVNNDYLECEAYQKKLNEAKGIHSLKVNEIKDQRTPSPDYRSPHDEMTVKTPVLPSPSPSPSPNPTPSGSQMVTIPLITLQKLSNLQSSPKTNELQDNKLNNNFLTNVMKYDSNLSVTDTSRANSISPAPVSPAASMNNMVRVSTPDLLSVMSPGQQDLQREGLQQMPEGGVLVSPLSIQYQALIDKMLKEQRNMVNAQQNAQQNVQQIAPPTAHQPMMNLHQQQLHQINQILLQNTQTQNQGQQQAAMQPQVQHQAHPQQQQQQAASPVQPVMNEEEMMAQVRELSRRLMESQNRQQNQQFPNNQESRFKF